MTLAHAPPGAGLVVQAWGCCPNRSPTLPEAEIATGAARVSVTAVVMPKGPKQQLSEPEWIGDAEGTSPAGEARGQGGNKRGKRRERRVPLF